MSSIYLDYAATSFPKAPGLGRCMQNYYELQSVNINRSTYALSNQIEKIVFDTRVLLADLFHFDDPSHVVFTPGITYSLNFVIKGFLEPGDHCLISPFEHNAALRPLEQLRSKGVSYSLLPCDEEGNIILEDLDAVLKPETKLVVLTHASNVFGNILPIQALCTYFHQKGIPVVLDTAQTAGHLDIDFKELDLAALCFTGHKGLMGPSGIGGMVLREDFAKHLTPLIAGGTGSASHLLDLPTYMPDRFESGTLNIGGIVGLYHALTYLKEVSTQHLHQKIMKCTLDFIEGIDALPHVHSIGHFPIDQRVGTVSITCDSKDLAELAFELEENYKILTRCGLHCAPIAHQTMGTFPEGTLRFSFGPNTSSEHIQAALLALQEITA